MSRNNSTNSFSSQRRCFQSLLKCNRRLSLLSTSLFFCRRLLLLFCWLWRVQFYRASSSFLTQQRQVINIVRNNKFMSNYDHEDSDVRFRHEKWDQESLSLDAERWNDKRSVSLIFRSWCSLHFLARWHIEQSASEIIERVSDECIRSSTDEKNDLKNFLLDKTLRHLLSTCLWSFRLNF